MNAISLLSGWTESGAIIEPPSATFGDGSDMGDIGIRRRTTRSKNRRGGQAACIDSDAPEQLDAPNGITAEREGGRRSDEMTGALKPPVAQAYEDLEESAQEAAARLGDFELDAAAIYPLPPPSPPPTPPLPASTFGVSSQVRISTATKDHPGATSDDSAIPVGRHKTRQGSVVNTDKARMLAQLAPVQSAVRLYIVLRRFLALFGIVAPSPPAELESYGESETPIARPILGIHQAAWKQDSNAPVHTTADTRARWRLPGFGSRKRMATADLEDPPAYAMGSTSASTRQSKHPKLDHDGTRPSPQPRLAHATRISARQIALDKPKLLVLDLDETLIHSTSRMGFTGSFSPVASSVDPRNPRSHANVNGLKMRIVEVVLDGRSVVYHVYKRPWVDFFLRKVSAWYTVIVFTASLPEYADPVIDWLDQGKGLIHGRLFRNSCHYINGSYVKDLAVIDPDLARVCLVDNSPASYARNQANGIPIEGWINDPNDEALLDLLPMLDSLRFTSDVRHILGLRLASTSTILPSKSSRRPRSSTAASMASSTASTDDDKA